MESPVEFVKQLSTKKKTLTEADLRKALEKAAHQGEPIVRPNPSADTDIGLKTAMKYFKVKK
jgi:hypothetical protein